MNNENSRQGLLTPKQAHTAICALRVAEQVYREDAAKMRVIDSDRIAEQFEQQARDAKALRETLEESHG